MYLYLFWEKNILFKLLFKIIININKNYIEFD